MVELRLAANPADPPATDDADDLGVPSTLAAAAAAALRWVGTGL